ncbi:Hypothetical protein NGAL_HAMBI2605_10330 [Neorhizobium galegae bv. orientalis]|nr:Hypothetical protein NGAL_HAMBI2605_10330 [Neorhizobium galegae bv. orientalis]
MIVCDCKSQGHTKCVCGAFKDGVLIDGATVRIPVFMRDSAPPVRKELHMMTDAEKQSMRDSVRGMPLYLAAKLSIYDSVRGTVTSGMPAEQYYALLDGADASRRHEPTEENVRMLGDQLAARREYAHELNNRWRGSDAQPNNDNRPSPLPNFARDGRPMSDLADHERAREEMIHRQTNAWKSE